MAHRHQRQPAAWPHVERDRRAQPHGRGNKRLRATRSCQLGGTLAVGPAARRLGPPRREQLNRRAAALPALRNAVHVHGQGLHDHQTTTEARVPLA